MNIVFASSKEYILFSSVLISSLKQSNNCMLNIYIIYSDEMMEEIKMIKNEFEDERCLVNDLKISDELLEQVKKLEVSSWNIATWYRWALTELLPGTLDRVLLMGLDTLVLDNIEDFYNQDFQNNVLVMCPDVFNTYCVGDEMVLAFKHKNMLDTYFNADIVLVDLKSYRNEINFCDFVEEASGKKWYCLDQDFINYKFRNRVKKADSYIYNYVPSLLDNGAEDVKIVHFAGVEDKPWKVNNGNNFYEKWWENAYELSDHMLLKILKIVKDNNHCAIYDLRKRLNKEIYEKKIILGLDIVVIDKIKYMIGRESNIAIYGYGVVGRKLLELLDKNGIKVKYVIEQNNIENVSNGAKHLFPDNIRENISLVISTPFGLEEIIKEKYGKQGIKVLSVEELILG